MIKQKSRLRQVAVILLMIALPLICIITEHLISAEPIDPVLIGKWFMFWGMGVQLFLTGLLGYLALRIASLKNWTDTRTAYFSGIGDSKLLNIAVGVLAMLSLYFNRFREATAIAGGIFFGLRAFGRLIRKSDLGGESLLILSDLFLFCMILLYLFFIIFFQTTVQFSAFR